MKWFVCLLDPCYVLVRPTVIRCNKTGTFIAAGHVSHKYNITSSETQSRTEKVAKIQMQLSIRSSVQTKSKLVVSNPVGDAVCGVVYFILIIQNTKIETAGAVALSQIKWYEVSQHQ